MELPASLVEEMIAENRIYFFRDDSPVGIPGHMHVCIKKSDRVLFFSTCTSQQDTVLKLHKYRGYDLDSFPCFIQNDVNKFNTRETYVNCNNIVPCDSISFIKYLSNKLIVPFDGKLSDEDMELISKGVLSSHLVPEDIKDLFR